MKHHLSFWPLSRILGLALGGAIAVAACNGDAAAPFASNSLKVRNAKAPSTADMSVSSTSPDSATQDTTLDVVINGSGFVAGASANWALAGVQDPTQVRTNTTTYVSSRKLVANITISASATVAKWDVVVTAAAKKGGIGSEAFAIKVKPNSDTNSRVNYVLANSVNVAPDGATPDVRQSGLIGDGRLRDGSSANGGDSEYQSRFCGSTGSIETMTSANGTPGNGNLAMQPGNGNVVCVTPRYFVATLDGVATHVNPLTRVPAIYTLGVGETRVTTASIAPNFSDCTYFEFDPAYGGSSVVVTRLDDGTGVRKWFVKSKSPHVAACAVLYAGKPGVKVTGKTYYLPFAFTITEVPYPWPSFP
jgi:hypothetical protein